jgi:hypothetical protein
MHLTITCEICEWRQRTERTFFWPQRVFIVCHQCEAPLFVQVTTDALARGICRQIYAA